MNILHIYRSMGQGGAQKIILQLCEMNNDKVRHFVASSGGKLTLDLKKMDVPHFEINLDGRRISDIFSNLNQLYKIVRIYDIEIIHSHHRMANFYSLMLKKIKPNLKCIYTAHNVFYDKRYFTKKALKESTIVAVGDGVAENLNNFFNIKLERIQVIHNAIKEKEIDTSNLDPLISKIHETEGSVIGLIGRISEQKGVDIFLRAMSIVSKDKENVYGVIVGDGEALQDMQRLAGVLNLEERVFFLGYKDNIAEIISQIDFAVLPSRWEGLPLTPIEVFSQGKTIIVSDIPGNSEVVQDNYNGLTFVSENHQDLANKITFLLENELLIKSLELKARESFENKYSYDYFQESYLKAYNKILSGG